MKFKLLPFLCFLVVAACETTTTVEPDLSSTDTTTSAVVPEMPDTAFLSYEEDIQNERDTKDLEFMKQESSPLEEADRQLFDHLKYFPVDASYKVNASLELNANPIEFEMPTTTERLPVYSTFGTLTFQLDGQEMTLEVYQNVDLVQDPEYANYLFVPFLDLTNGNASYGGGRYIDFEFERPNNPVQTKFEVEIDFNKAYNPYCGYNHKFSCPIPPAANHLPFNIEAGEMAFGEHH